MKPTLPQGTRDFGPETVRKRQYIFNIIRTQFELFGFQPLETPAFENLDTLMGKYGDEGDKLIFKILNNGLERPEKHESSRQLFEQVLQGKLEKGITERALKYDLTIPFARYVAMNHNLLTMPFKRYQIQPVWRADRPQRGRYREFYQCDADVVGSRSLINEAELLQLYTTVFSQLKIDVKICINNRKILVGLAEACGFAGNMMDITIAIDKLDKIGLDKVIEELRNKGLTEDSLQKIQTYLKLSEIEGNSDILQLLKNFFAETPIALEGIQEIETLISFAPQVSIDVTLARGLNYYTGTIIEVKPLGIQMGSIGGGGRYDDLTGLFGVSDIPGVGISFGVDRIYDVMEELKLFPENLEGSLQVMLVNFGETFNAYNFSVMQTLRNEGISCEMYPEPIKFDKQLKYAGKRNIPYVVLIGEDEMNEEMISVKNFTTGLQHKMRLTEVISRIKQGSL
ncbi:MAG: histidine--tRNA ligase [Chitinophagaceae bacterium]|nr:histidine--tRNA ligase [Chitinophagaceae bacterium]